MTGRSKARSLYLAVESSYQTDPSADGSGYTAIPAEGLGYPVDNLELLETDTATGTLNDTPPEPGRDGASIDFSIPMLGMLTRAGDGTDASTITDDWLDMILEHIFGTQRTLVGDGVDVGSTASNLITDGDETYAVGDLLPVYSGGLAIRRAQWAHVDTVNSASDYDVSPDFVTSLTTAYVAYGSKNYRFSRGGGSTLAGVFVDDNIGTYENLGGRITSFTVAGEAGKRIMAQCSMRFSSKNEDAAGKSALPAAAAAPATTTLKCISSPVWFNGVQYGTKRAEVQWGLETAPVDDVGGIEGRSGDEVIRLVPRVVIEPLRTDAILELKRNQTTGPVMVQIGAGDASGSSLGGMCFAFDQGHVENHGDSDDQGHARNTITIKITNPRAGRIYAQASRF